MSGGFGEVEGGGGGGDGVLQLVSGDEGGDRVLLQEVQREDGLGGLFLLGLRGHSGYAVGT